MDDKELTFGMNNYLVSLVGPLIGYYIRVQAPNRDIVREWARKNLGGVWCSIYQLNHKFIDEPRIIGEIIELWDLQAPIEKYRDPE